MWQFQVNLVLGAVLSLALLTVACLIIAKRRRAKRCRTFVLKGVENKTAFDNVDAVVKARILDELALARKGPRTLKSIDGASAQLPEAAIVLPNELRWLEPITKHMLDDSLIISVTALPAIDDQASLFVQLNESNEKQLESRFFHQASLTPGGASAYDSLAVEAGVWLAFMLARHRHRGEVGRRDVQLLGSTEWESVAFYRHGMRAKRDSRERRMWLNAALFADHRNLAALVEYLIIDSHNVAALTSVHLGTDHADLATDIMGRLEDDSPDDQMSTKSQNLHFNTLWYQACYRLCAYHLNAYFALKDDPQRRSSARSHLAKSLSLGLELSRSVGATMLELRKLERSGEGRRPRSNGSDGPGDHADLKYLLDKEGLDLVTLVAGPIAVLDREQLNEQRSSGFEAHRSDYTVDRDWMELMDPKKSNPKLEDAKMWKAFSTLAPPHTSVSSSLSDGMECNGEGRKMPSALTILEMQLCATGDLSSERSRTVACLPWRARYQRACVLAELGLFDESADLLAQVLVHAEDVEEMRDEAVPQMVVRRWVTKDPVLSDLWQVAGLAAEVNGDFVYVKDGPSWQFLRQIQRVPVAIRTSR
ncbi:hypothetical protein ACT4S2_07115 [Kocuria turfanensis]|uniref:hypothetical protein n=1 Tax=Kocuria turfanensis TaxID=388357 RepID=UPI0040368C4C